MSRESLLDKSLDEIIGSSGPASRGGRRAPRGVSKPSSRGRRRGHGSSFRPRGDSYVADHSGEATREIEELSRGSPYLRISNLSPEISEHDVFQLFDQVGPVSFCRVMIDTQGNSKGIAYVGYVDFDRDNGVAIDKFDGRRAAGEVITVREVGRARGANPLLGRISSVQRPSRRDLLPRRAERKPKPKKKTAEELDAELDSYFGQSDLASGDVGAAGDPNPPFPAV